jgi:hypothetical protein
MLARARSAPAGHVLGQTRFGTVVGTVPVQGQSLGTVPTVASVADADEVKTPRGRGRAGLRSIAALEQGASSSGGRSSIVPTSVRTMCRRKLLAVSSSSSASPRRCQTALSILREKDPVLRLRRREGPEIVLAEQELRRLGEALLVERRGYHQLRFASKGEGVRRGRRGSDSSAPRPNGEHGNRARRARRRVTATSSGSSAFSASAARSGGGPPPPGGSQPARARGRLCQCGLRPPTRSSSERPRREASRMVPSTVRRPGCAAQPLKPVPSYRA